MAIYTDDRSNALHCSREAVMRLGEGAVVAEFQRRFGEARQGSAARKVEAAALQHVVARSQDSTKQVGREHAFVRLSAQLLAAGSGRLCRWRLGRGAAPFGGAGIPP
mmetsp:Transcript_790/g.2339  ORF Transcript_790/g.2339 Transcript_790/m.2339 type:complete len:107 (+) Transcript_790:1001-1321(+)